MLDLLLRLLAASGDRVITELPTYSGAIDAIGASAARLLPVPLAPRGGWDVEALEAALRQNAPRLAYLAGSTIQLASHHEVTWDLMVRA